VEPTNRRQFLKRSSAVAAAAGLAAAAPGGVARALTSTPNSAEPTLPSDSTVDVPVVAHVTNVRKGTVTLYAGEREINIKNKRLAAALYDASRSGAR